MKQQTVGICLVSGDSALRDDVQAVLDRLNHWLGHETPAASQSWPDNDPQCLYRQVAEQAQAYVREHAESARPCTASMPATAIMCCSIRASWRRNQPATHCSNCSQPSPKPNVRPALRCCCVTQTILATGSTGLAATAC